MPTTSPNQPELFGYIPTVNIPQGDGSFLIKPGKPIRWLTAKQFGEAVGLSEDSIYRYKNEGGWFATEHVREAGLRPIRFDAAAIEPFLAESKRRRDARAKAKADAEAGSPQQSLKIV